MQLNLKNPLVFFDLETTGINIVKDRIVEISFVKVYRMEKKNLKRDGSIRKCPFHRNRPLFTASPTKM